ncbi:MAG: hypothetical protein WKF72_04285, partial [Nocardioidaceae bacterium]
MGYGSFGGKEETPLAKVVHIADSESQVSEHATLAASAHGDLSAAVGNNSCWGLEKHPMRFLREGHPRPRGGLPARHHRCLTRSRSGSPSP